MKSADRFATNTHQTNMFNNMKAKAKPKNY